jgi:hypothetical protein
LLSETLSAEAALLVRAALLSKEAVRPFTDRYRQACAWTTKVRNGRVLTPEVEQRRLEGLLLEGFLAEVRDFVKGLEREAVRLRALARDAKKAETEAARKAYAEAHTDDSPRKGRVRGGNRAKGGYPRWSSAAVDPVMYEAGIVAWRRQ